MQIGFTRFINLNPRVLHKSLILALACLCLAPPVKAELIFSAPPRESAEAGQALYAPLAEALGEVLGEKVVYEHPKDWITYSFKMRKGRYDLVFDGAHFSAWRMVHLAHEPLVALEGDMVFYLLARKDNPAARLSDLNGKRICGPMPPNLGSVSIISQYDNPSRVPIIQAPEQGDFPQAYQDWLAGKCEAVIMRDHFYTRKVPEDIKRQSRIIYRSPPVPNQTLTAGPRVDPARRRDIIRQFTQASGAQAAAGVFERFNKGEDHFISTDKARYSNLNLLLEGHVWGW